MNPASILLSEEYTDTLPGLPLLHFTLPPILEASEPPEARGLARDQVGLMVSRISTDEISHTSFRQLGSFLLPGDLLVLNTSGTLNAALPATRADGTHVELHLSTRQPSRKWVVELRAFVDESARLTRPFHETGALQPGEQFILPAEGRLRLIAPYAPGQTAVAEAEPTPLAAPRTPAPVSPRLWVAELTPAEELVPYLEAHGAPIRYSYVREEWPLSYYQTVYATEPGSAEMPSAGRAFTPELLTGLMARGVQIAPLLLHTGVASVESHEPPYPEYYRVPEPTARLVNAAHAAGQRVIAVGTTVVRALESATGADGQTRPLSGWTDLLITPERGLRAVDGLLTGLHEPRSTHLAMLETLAGRRHLELTYRAAIEQGYLWHEFGDLHLILP